MICLTVLSLAVTGVLAGCRSLTAIWEHATDLTAADLEALGLQVGQALASESTIRRVLQDLDPTNLDTHVRSWLCTRSGIIEGRTVIAVDGKTMRAARTGKDPAPHLLAALDQATGTVLAQARVADKSNEIPALRELLKPLDLDGVVVSADAMHTQTDTAEWTRPAGRSLRAHASGQSEDPAQDTQEAALTRTSRPPPGATSLTGDERGAPPEATWAPTWVDFPGAAQVVQVRRTRTTKDRRSTGNNGGGSAKRTTVEVVCPGLLPTHGTG
ncbi:ISAs1 family transposase, partial [Actinomyces oris]|uniref:ISAs1 family transposase n=1 Tax=Actinomyces oris TaxID=544580 RepID=UPI000AA8735C